MLVTLRHTNKHVYFCMSQYSSKWYVMTKMVHLLKLRNIKHTDPISTNERLNVKNSRYTAM